ncbi:MAG: hypothetical protein BAJALOKI2v1_160005 [Promethearchaeota archaeon]|nr:MAG: hypothetical protein BAJALOKI2v1_160005 [Candidatus Lokiarchaeota archaeon]
MTEFHLEKKSKEEVKSEIASIFKNISCKNENPIYEEILTKEEELNKIRCDFDAYLETTAIHLQSILRLWISPSTGRSDNKEISRLSLDKIMEKINKFHDFISKNRERLDYYDSLIMSFKAIVSENPTAKRVFDQFQLISNKNIKKIKLIVSDFKLLLQEYGIFPEDPAIDKRQYQKNLKIFDSLLKLIILKHEPIKSVYDYFN